MALREYEAEMRERVLQEIPISVAQAQMVHSFDTLMNAPFFKHGMNKVSAPGKLEWAKGDSCDHSCLQAVGPLPRLISLLQYREEREREGKDVEVATDSKAL